MPTMVSSASPETTDVELPELWSRDELAPPAPDMPAVVEPEWWRRAACRDMDTDAFYPVNVSCRTTHVTPRVQAVLNVCRVSCPVRGSCLRDAVDTGDWENGIRAGLLPAERKPLVRPVAQRRYDEQVARLIEAVRRVPDAARDALARAEHGSLPQDAATETRRWLIRAGFAHESVRSPHGGRNATRGGVRLTQAGRQLAQQLREQAS